MFSDAKSGMTTHKTDNTKESRGYCESYLCPSYMTFSDRCSRHSAEGLHQSWSFTNFLHPPLAKARLCAICSLSKGTNYSRDRNQITKRNEVSAGIVDPLMDGLDGQWQPKFHLGIGISRRGTTRPSIRLGVDSPDLYKLPMLITPQSFANLPRLS